MCSQFLRFFFGITTGQGGFAATIQPTGNWVALVSLANMSLRKKSPSKRGIWNLGNNIVAYETYDVMWSLARLPLARLAQISVLKLLLFTSKCIFVIDLLRWQTWIVGMLCGFVVWQVFAYTSVWPYMHMSSALLPIPPPQQIAVTSSTSPTFEDLDVVFVRYGSGSVHWSEGSRTGLIDDITCNKVKGWYFLEMYIN